MSIPRTVLPFRSTIKLPEAIAPSNDNKPPLFLVTLMPDDSTSMHGFNQRAVCRAGGVYLDVFSADPERKDVLVRTRYMKGPELHGFVAPVAAERMNNENYKLSPGTPLFAETIKTLAEAEAAASVYSDAHTVRTYTYIMTDGGDSSGESPAAVRAVVERMIASGQHIIGALGVDDGYTDFMAVFRSMGIPEQWIQVLRRREESIVQGLTVAAHTTSHVVNIAHFDEAAHTGFARASRHNADPHTDTLGVTQLGEMIAPKPATQAVHRWQPVDQGSDAIIKWMPELGDAGEYVLQFPDDVKALLLGRQTSKRGLEEAGVKVVELRSVERFVSRRHIKIERLAGWSRFWRSLAFRPNTYRITVLDKLDDRQLYAAVDGEFIKGRSQIVADGSIITLAPGLEFRLGLPKKLNI